MSPLDFNLMVEGYLEAQAEKDKKEWYHTRRICWLIYQANADPKKSAKSESLWWPIAGEPKLSTKIKGLNKKDIQNVQNMLQRLNNNGRR